LVEESKDEDEVIWKWKCLLCKVYMDFNFDKCTKCNQSYRNEFAVDVNRKELNINEYGH